MSGPSERRAGRSRALLAALLVAETVVIAVGLQWEFVDHLLWTEVAATALFLAALVTLPRAGLSWRSAVAVVVGVGAVLQVAAIGATPKSSDDVYRYVWDAKVQLSGTDPYRYVPSAPQLAALRSPALFPPGNDCYWRLSDGQCTKINRPEVRTAYPPVAEAAFVLVRLGSLGMTDSPIPPKIFGALGAVALSLLLAWWARRERRPVWTVAVWAWCPVTAVEIGNTAHIDWLAALLSVAALVLSRERRPGLAGLALGAAIATKLYPGLLLPSLLRRRPVLTVVAAVGLIAVSYLPHVLAVGPDVLGYLPGYLKEESYLDGRRFFLLGLLFPVNWLTPAAVLVMAAVAAWAVVRTDPDRPELTAVVVVGIAFLVSTPAYSWYTVLLLALVAMTGALEWLPVVVAPTVAMFGSYHFGDGIGYRTVCYAVALVAVVALSPLRRRRISTRSSPSTATPPRPAAAAGASGGSGRPSRPH